MALYKYLATSPGESPREVLIEADTEKESLDKLRRRGMIPVRSFGEAGEKRSGGFTLTRRKIDVFDFTRQLAPLLNAYIPLERALSIIAEGAAEADQKEFVNSMRQGLHEGKKFSELVRSHGSLFPTYYANLIESGEETGCLPEVVNELHKFMGESKELKDFIVSSSVYPLSILVIVLGVTVLLFTVFVPKFAKIFYDMGRELPGAMNALVAFGDFAKWAWWMIPLGLYLAYIVCKHLYGEAEMKRKISGFIIKLPLLGGILVDLEMCKYLRTLAILIANHVEIIRTVKIAGRIISNPVVSAEFDGIDRKLKGGEKLSAALTGNRFIPAGTVPMLRVGEESGTVGEMLGNISGNLEADTRLRIKRLLSLFEPAVIVFLAAIVLVVVVAIFVAMMEINSISQGGPKV